MLGHDGVFSIDTGLELVGVAGSICWDGSPNNLQPIMNGRSSEDAHVGSPMPKSIYFLHKLKNLTLYDVMIAYLLLVGLLDIYNILS